MADTKLLPDHISNVCEHFKRFAADDGCVHFSNIGKLLRKCGENLPNYKLRKVIERIQNENGGNIDLEEFLDLLGSFSSKSVGAGYTQQVDRPEGLLQVGGCSSASNLGTRHSFVKEDEVEAFSDWINTVLDKDQDLQGKYIPIDIDSAEGLFDAMKDGIVLCKLINWAGPGTIDERALNKSNTTVYEAHENLTLGLNSARSIGCNIVNIGAEDIIEGRHHLVLGLLWQITKIGLFNEISVRKVPGMYKLLEPGEDLEDLTQMPPEDVLLRWVNYHLKEAKCGRRISDFTQDITDSEVYSVLLKQIAPMEMDVHLPHHKVETDLLRRAELVLDAAHQLNCRHFVRPKDVVRGNAHLNLAFVCNLFHTYPALEAFDDVEIPSDVEETKEQKTCRNWMNSLGVEPPVYNIREGLKDGLILLQTLDKIKPGIVCWTKVNKRPFKAFGGNMKKLENCNYALLLCKQLNLSLYSIGGEDILQGHEKLTLGLLCQLMEFQASMTLQQCRHSNEPIKETEIVTWVNTKLKDAGQKSQIRGFRDKSISNCITVLDLIDSICPKSVNRALIQRENNQEKKLLNAKYAISLARKIGAKVYALPEDLVAVKYKTVKTFCVCLMASYVSRSRQL